MNFANPFRIESAVRAWSDWMLPMAWQVGLLVVILTGLTWVLRRRSARLRYALWLLVPLRLILPPTLALATGWAWWLLPVQTPDTQLPEPAAVQAVANVVPVAPSNAVEPTELGQAATPEPDRPVPPFDPGESATVAPVHPSWAPWMFIAWATIVGGLLLRLCVGAIQTTRMVHAAELSDDAELQALVDRHRRHLGIRRPVAVRLSSDCSVPLVAGILRPAILVPRDIVDRLDARELEAVLIHELNHVARHDILTNLLQAVLTAFYFFHPLVWWANARLCRLREDACDESTVATLQGRRRAYGSGIVKIAEMVGGNPGRLTLAVVESKPLVKHRLQRILDPRLPFGNRLRWTARAFLVLIAAILLPAAAHHNDQTQAENQTQAEETPGKPVVSATAVSDNSLASPLKSVRVPVRVSGVLAEVLVKQGDVVKKGQVLARLDDRLARLEFRARKVAAQNDSAILGALAREAKAQAEVEDDQKLFNRKLMSEQEFRVAKARLEIAKSGVDDAKATQMLARVALERAEMELKMHEVVSPIDGVVSQLVRQEGESVQALDPMMQIIGSDRVKAPGE